MINSFTSLLKYGFFDGPQDVAALGYSGQDKMSPRQFIVMGTLFIVIILVSLFLRKVKKETVFAVYKILAVFMPLLEVAKISFSTYHDFRHGDSFNLGGILPLYTCSMLLFFLPFVAWGKGWIQKTSMAFFTSIGMVAGLTNFIYLSAAGFYPIFTFGGLYSVFYHGVLVFIGMSLLITEIYVPTWKTVPEGMIPVLLFSLFVIPANFLIKCVPGNEFVDYMLLMNANGFVPAISDFFILHHIQLLFSLMMLFVIYPAATLIIVLIEMGICRLISLFRKRGTCEKGREAVQ
ncbi:MAG: YwaF family protein [Clostridia bacterium]|nr:YwaF family protein [Clostridia bacterium]